MDLNLQSSVTGIFIKNVLPSSPAGKAGHLKVGDQGEGGSVCIDWRFILFSEDLSFIFFLTFVCELFVCISN